MQVGVNYPWFDYGWDFGLAPPGWRGTTPRWHQEIGRDLEHFHDLGISVVRWFVLADGLAYGNGREAPAPGASGCDWCFEPPPLDRDLLDHFSALLQRFADVNAGVSEPIRLLPVLIDFHFCHHEGECVAPHPHDAEERVHDSEWVKQGRADAIADADKRQVFFDEVLDPLLQVSQTAADVIYAWELINEPDWITNGWHPDCQRHHPIDEACMRAFLDEGKKRIRRAGFKPTIGFALYDTLRTSGVTAEINQFHHYPGGRGELPVHSFDSRYPAIIGEFATTESDVWPDLGASQTMLNRLRHAAAKRFPMAMPWSFRTRDRHAAWTPDVERDIRTFTSDEARVRSLSYSSQ